LSQIVLLAAQGISTNIVYHALAREFSSLEIIIEASVPRTQFLKRRIKKLGILTVIGQILFIGFVERWLRISSAHRASQILQEFDLNASPIAKNIHYVASANSEETRDLLRQFNPKIVVINGTRILATETLESLAAHFVNMHAGITPAYRGVHGGYWALAEGHPEFVGTTIHFVDKGIDTGKVIRQETIQITNEDSFVTYPFLQLGVGVPALVGAVREILSGEIVLQNPISSLPSKLHSHPTLWQYLLNRIVKKIK
jgi:folate-dependent phosphoribosylglycinamide formyltransferase PurN